MPPPPPAFARRISGRVEFRAGPTPLSLTLSGLRAADGNDATVYVSTAVRPVDRAADIQLFAEQFLNGRDAVNDDDLCRQFAAALSPTAAAFVSARDAATAVTQQAALLPLLRERLDATAFAAGLELAGPLTITLDSDGLRDDQRQQRNRVRQRADADHAARLAAALADVGPAHCLPVADQAALLPTLRAAAPATRVAMSAGPNVVVLDADDALHTFAVAGVGPLRCVRQIDPDTFAVGGTGGVAILDADFAPTHVLPSAAASARGYNAVARLPTGDVIAAHGEFGLTVWPASGPPRVFATPGPARGMVVVNGRVLLAAGETLCTFDGDAVRAIDDGAATTSTIVAPLPFGEIVAIVCRDGALRALDAATLGPTGGGRIDGPLTAAAALDVAGLRAIVTADDRGRLEVTTVEGRSLGRLAGRAAGVKMLAAAGGRVVAVTADRASVLILDTDGGPPRTINVLARTGHHVTDAIGAVSTLAADVV